jgi:hypothetical protein
MWNARELDYMRTIAGLRGRNNMISRSPAARPLDAAWDKAPPRTAPVSMSPHCNPIRMYRCGHAD